MKHQRPITVLVFILAIAATAAAAAGIFSAGGPGPHEFQSIRGKSVSIYGRGIYQHMSAEVAPQGIAQDYVTLFAAIPCLLVSLFFARAGSLKGRFLLAGTLGYFLVTYLFYLMMAMYNALFLGYVVLLCASFFAFALTLLSFDIRDLPAAFRQSTPLSLAGGFLVFNAFAIAFLWMSIVMPPLLDGTVVPVQVEHYTTLVVQGLDLSILLPLSFLAGILFRRRKPSGYLMAPIYFVFLSFLMLALTAKLIGMASLGYNVIPAIFIIPVFALLSIAFSIAILKDIKEPTLS